MIKTVGTIKTSPRSAVAEHDLGGAIVTVIFVRQLMGTDEGMTGKITPDFPPQDARAFAVDDIDLIITSLVSGMEEFIQPGQGFVHSQSMKVDLLRNIAGMAALTLV